MYCVILLAALFGINCPPANPPVLPVPGPNPLCLMLGSVDDNHTSPSNGAPVGLPAESHS